MDPAQFFAASRVVIVAGKGGVGKTTVTAAMAVAAARCGFSTLVVEVEAKSGLAACFGRPPLGYREVELWPGGGPHGDADVRARTLTPDDALLEYLEDHGMRRISRRLVGSGAIDVVSTAVPGIRDILVLGKVKQLERSGAADLILIDAPAAGHALTFLTSARGLVDAVRVGPIHTQAADVQELLTDPARCRVVLVTLPEETPVNEVGETAALLTQRVGVRLGPVVVNACYPPLAGIDVDPVEAAHQARASLRPGEAEVLAEAAEFRRERQTLQSEQIARLAERLPLAQIPLPFLFTADLGPAEIERLAEALLAGLDELDEATLEAQPGRAGAEASVGADAATAPGGPEPDRRGATP